MNNVGNCKSNIYKEITLEHFKVIIKKENGDVVLEYPRVLWHALWDVSCRLGRLPKKIREHGHNIVEQGPLALGEAKTRNLRQALRSGYHSGTAEIKCAKVEYRLMALPGCGFNVFDDHLTPHVWSLSEMLTHGTQMVISLEGVGTS